MLYRFVYYSFFPLLRDLRSCHSQDLHEPETFDPVTGLADHKCEPFVYMIHSNIALVCRTLIKYLCLKGTVSSSFPVSYRQFFHKFISTPPCIHRQHKFSTLPVYRHDENTGLQWRHNGQFSFSFFMKKKGNILF